MSSGSLYRRIQVCNCFKIRTVKRVTIRLIRLRAVTFEYVYLYFKHRSKTVDMGRKFGIFDMLLFRNLLPFTRKCYMLKDIIKFINYMI